MRVIFCLAGLNTNSIQTNTANILTAQKLLPFKITCKKVQDGKVVENPRNVKKKTKNSKHQDFFERFDLKLISRIAIAIIVVILAIVFAIWASTTDHGVL